MKPVISRQTMADLLQVDTKTLYHWLKRDKIDIPPRTPLTIPHQIKIFDKYGWPESLINQMGISRINSIRSLYQSAVHSNL